MELIDKAAVVAEIEKIIEGPAPSHDSQCSWEDGYYCGLCKAESIIDNLEVKEVNLEEEICSFFSKNPIPYEHITDWPLLKNCAIYFFELGLKAQKGE